MCEIWLWLLVIACKTWELPVYVRASIHTKSRNEWKEEKPNNPNNNKISNKPERVRKEEKNERKKLQ